MKMKGGLPVILENWNLFTNENLFQETIVVQCQYVTVKLFFILAQ